MRALPTHIHIYRVKIAGSDTAESRVWGMGGHYNTTASYCFDYGRYPCYIIPPLHPPSPRYTGYLPASRPKWLTSVSYPLWAGFTGVKWVAVIEGNTGSVRLSPPCHQNVKTCELHAPKTKHNREIESERERRARKCRIPVFPRRRRVAETRFDCCPRPRTPFLLVSEAALALAGREGETQQNSVIFNSCLPEKPAKHPHSPVPKGADCEIQLCSGGSEEIWGAELDCLLCQLRG